jgi:hypothetical protein
MPARAASIAPHTEETNKSSFVMARRAIVSFLNQAKKSPFLVFKEPSHDRQLQVRVRIHETGRIAESP